MRWKAVIPITIVIVLIVVFTTFFLDNILKGIIISIGQGIFGAKVDIARLSTKWLSIEIQGLQIANKNSPMNNLIEIGRIGFRVKFLPLLSAKIIIDEIGVTEVHFATQRKTSGVLPPKKIKKIEKKKAVKARDTVTKKLIDTVKKKGLEEVSKIGIISVIADIKRLEQESKQISLDKVITETGLESVTELEKLITTYNKLYENYTTEFTSLEIDKQLKLVNDSISEIGSIKITSTDDIPMLQEKINKLNRHRESLREAANKIFTLKNSLTKDFGEQKDLLAHVNDLINKDYQKILSKLKIEPITAKDITRAIIGPIWLGYTNKILQVYHFIHAHLPRKTKEDANKVVYPRMKGVDVIFYRKNILPRFLVKRVCFSDNTSEKILSIQGDIIDINSDPGIYKKPTLVNITGQKGATKLSIKGIFDHTIEPANDKIIILLENYPITTLTQVEYLPNIAAMVLDTNAEFGLNGNELFCEADIRLRNMKFVHTEPKDDLQKIVYEVIMGLKEIHIFAKLYGTIDNLSTEITTNIDKEISTRIKAIYTDKINQLTKQLKETIDKALTEKKETLLKQYTLQKEILTKLYTEKQAQLQEYIDLVKKKVDELKNKILEQEKKKAEEQLKEKVIPEIEKLFKK